MAKLEQLRIICNFGEKKIRKIKELCELVLKLQDGLDPFSHIYLSDGFSNTIIMS